MVGIFPRSLLDAFNQDSLTQMGDAMQSTVNDKVEGFRSLVNPLLHANDAVHQGQLEDIAHDPVNLYQGADPTPYSSDSNPFNAAGLSGQHGLDEPAKPNAISPFPGLTGQTGDPNESSGLSVDQLTTDSANGQDDALTNDGQPQKAGVMKYKPVISQAAATYNVPTDVLAGIMDIESGGRPTPGSAALGPMQVMPFHFKDGEDGNDPTTNINKAAEILAQNYKAYGSWDKAAAAYFGAIDSQGNISNASDGNIDGPGYVARFQAARGRYSDLGVSPSGDLTVPSKQDVGITDQSALDDPDKWSLCGPVAAVLAAQAHGANWTVAQAKALAQKMGTWDSGTGMHGLASEVSTLKQMGIDASVGTADQDRLAQEATNGNTPIISTPKHYFVAQGYNPDTKEFNVGTTGTIFRGGKQWMTLDEIKSLGGGLDGAAYMDNPASTTPSSVASTSTSSRSTNSLDMVKNAFDNLATNLNSTSDNLTSWLNDTADNIAQYGPNALEQAKRIYNQSPDESIASIRSIRDNLYGIGSRADETPVIGDKELANIGGDILGSTADIIESITKSGENISILADKAGQGQVNPVEWAGGIFTGAMSLLNAAQPEITIPWSFAVKHLTEDAGIPEPLANTALMLATLVKPGIGLGKATMAASARGGLRGEGGVLDTAIPDALKSLPASLDDAKQFIADKIKSYTEPMVVHADYTPKTETTVGQNTSNPVETRTLGQQVIDNGGLTLDTKTGEHYDASQGGIAVSHANNLETTVLKASKGDPGVITTPRWKGSLDDAISRFKEENQDTLNQDGVYLGVEKRVKGDQVEYHLDASSVHNDPREALQATLDRRKAVGYNPKVGSPVSHDFESGTNQPLDPTIRSGVDRAENYNPTKPTYVTPEGDKVNFDSATEYAKYRQNDRRVAAGDITSWSRAGREYVMKYNQADAHGNPVEGHSFTPDTKEVLPNGDIVLDEIKSNQFRGYPQNMAKEETLGILKPGVAYPVDDTNFVLPTALRGNKKVFIRFSTEKSLQEYEPGGVNALRDNLNKDAQEFKDQYSGHFSGKNMDQQLSNLKSVGSDREQDPIAGMTNEEVRDKLRELYAVASQHEIAPPSYVDAKGVTHQVDPYHGNQVTAAVKGKILSLSEALAQREGREPTAPVPHVMSQMPWNAARGAPELPTGQPMWSLVPGAAAGGDPGTDENGNPTMGYDIPRGLIGMAAMHGGVEHFGSQAERDAHIANRLTGAPRELVPNRAVPPGEAPSLIRGEQASFEGQAPHEMLGPNQATPPGEQPRAPQASESMFPGLKPEEMFGPHAAQAPGEAPKAPRDASQPGFKGMAPEDLFNPVTQNKDIPPSIQPHLRQGSLPGVQPATRTPPEGVKASDWWDAIRYSSLLSAPGTTIRNVASGLYQIPRKVLVDFMSQNPGTSLNEAKGAIAGMGTGLRSALETLLTGESSIAQDLKDRLGTSAQSTLAPRINLADQGGLTGLIGKGLASVSNVMRAPDEFFHQVALHAELGRLSFARAEELAAKFNVPFDDALQHVLSMNDEETLQKAVDVANKLTYRTPLEGWAKSIQTGVDKVPLGIGKAIVPFYHAVHNIAATTVEELPLIGSLRADSSLSKGQKIASQAVSMATAGTALFMAANGNLSGAGPTDQQERDKLTRSGWMPYSFKTPDGAWHSYDNLGPLAGTLSAAANGYEASTDKALDDKGQLARVQRFGQDFARSLINNTPARGVADIYDLTDRKTSQDQVDSVIAGYASQVIPLGGLVNAATSAFDSRTRDPQGVIQRIQSRLGPERGLLPAKLDALGQEIPNPQQGFNAFAPTRQNLQRSNSVEEELARHNVPLSATGDTIGTNKVKLDQFQEHDLQRRAGANITSGVQVLMSDPRYNALNDTEKEQALTRIRDDATSAAKNSIVDPSVANRKPEGEPQKYEGVKGFSDEYKIDQARAKVNAWKASQKTDNPLPDPSNDEMNLALSSIPTQDYKDYLLQKSGITTNTRRSEAFAFNAR